MNDGNPAPLPAEISGVRRRRRKKAGNSWRSRLWLDSRIIHRGVNIVGAVLGLIFVVLSIKQFHNGFVFYGEYKLGETKQEALYGFNQPQLIRESDSEPWRRPGTREEAVAADKWRYILPAGSRVDLSFDGEGRANRLACGGDIAVVGACPAAFGVSLGSDEDLLIYQIGQPDEEIFAGPAKTSVYSGLGLAVRLEQFHITQIVLTEAPGFLPAVGRYLRWAVP